MPNVWPQVAGGLIGLLGAVIVAVLAARFTAERFYKERTWERKASAYTAVFESLHTMLVWSGEFMEDATGARTLSEERQSELSRDYAEAKKRVRREIAGLTWLLDRRVEEEMERLWRELSKRRDNWFDVLDESYGAIANAQEQLRTIARADLQLDSRTRWWKVWKHLNQREAA